MPQVILISQVPLPYSQIGSWTTLYHNYLIDNHAIDYIVCEQPKTAYPEIHYGIVSSSFSLKLQKKIAKNPYLGYIEALEKILEQDEKFIIQIIDNFGIVKPLIEFLEKKGKRKQCYLQFFYHSFPPFYENFTGRWFFESIDEMVLLTNDSYQAHKNYYTVLPTKFSVLHNGIDTLKFHKVTPVEKENLRASLGITNKNVFVWCSQDRPKKGLDLILDVWKRIHNQYPDSILLIIGANRDIKIEGVSFLGKIPNNELPKYYQAADCYVFPTLCHEGFGMSLIEALHCGCYCIASSIGGIPEVLQYGKLGKLIEAPHFIQEWIDAIDLFLNQDKANNYSIPENLYSMQNWNNEMNRIIENAKKNLNS